MNRKSTRRIPMRRHPIAAAVLILSTLVAGCGSDDAPKFAQAAQAGNPTLQMQGNPYAQPPQGSHAGQRFASRRG